MFEIEEITLNTVKEKDTLFKNILPKEEEGIRDTNDTMQEMKSNLHELEDLYQNYNSVSDKLLEYKQINFKEYIEQALLLRKP